ncbi:hypothetical protein QYF36_010973 [Acer negundo]|nr:hypothetical protein QYF36_010973 [Acer negundo]
MYATPALVPPATPTLSPPTPLSKRKEKTQISSSTIIAIVAPLTVAAVLFVAVYCILTRRARKKNITTEDEIDGKDILTAETLQFDLGTIQAATNRFSTDNKLGAGGFGVVYKGVLPNGKDIAVKRLSKRSGQGAEEFKNELELIKLKEIRAKLWGHMDIWLRNMLCKDSFL